ncbi:MAG: PAS domain S-box protein [Candidatus Aminicenantes bacterium]
MSFTINLLLAGIKPEAVDLIRDSLGSNGIRGKFEVVSDSAGLKTKLRESFDIVIMDLDSGPFKGSKVFSLIKQFKGDVSFILSAGDLDKDKEEEAFRKGAADIIENKHPERLCAVIRREAENIRLRKKQKTDFLKLQESEARYRAIFHRTGTAKCLFSEDGVIQLANSQFIKLTGFNLSQLKGKKKWMDFVFKEDRPKLESIIKLSQSKKSYLPWKEEFRMVDTCGTLKFLIGTFSMIPETGEHTLSLADITGLKLVQEKFKESEKRLATAQRMARLGNWEWDIKSDRLAWSNEIYRIMEKNRENFSPSFQSFLEAVHPDDRGAVRRAVRNSFLKKAPYSIEHRIQTPGGKEKTLHERGDVIRDERGKPVRMVGTVQDITRRSQMEEINRRLAAAVLNIREGILLFDSRKKVLFVNPALEGILGYPPGELMGKSLDDLGIINDGDEYSSPGSKGNRPVSKRILFRKKDGEKIDVDIFLSPVRESGHTGKILFTVLVLRDITAEVRMEKNLRKIHKMEALGTLAGGISHDLNNILMPIVLNTELALWQIPDNDPVRDFLGQVLAAAKRGKDLVNQVVSFSRQEPNEMKTIRIIPLVKEASRLIRSSIPAEIAIHHRILTEEDMIYGNPTQIHQVLMNLCSNAAQAFQEERGKIVIALEAIRLDPHAIKRYPGLSPGRYLKLSITDDGCGIPEKIIDKIFDPFFTTKKSSEGTGMGLAVVEGIVRKHRGAVNVYSEEGKGSAFNVFFPVREKEGQEEQEEQFDFPEGNEHILVVDDETSVLKSLNEILGKLGYTVTACHSARKALNILQSHQEDAFDLILTDQTMPDMTGLELARKAKKMERKKIPVILLSGFSEKINEKELRRAGISKYLAKPVDSAKLALSVRSVLDGDQRKEGIGNGQNFSS